MGSIGKGYQTTNNNKQSTSDGHLPWTVPWALRCWGRWYIYEIFIDSCTENLHDLEKDRWLFGQVGDHGGIYGSKAVEGLSVLNVGHVQRGGDLLYMPFLCGK